MESPPSGPIGTISRYPQLEWTSDDLDRAVNKGSRLSRSSLGSWTCSSKRLASHPFSCSTMFFRSSTRLTGSTSFRPSPTEARKFALQQTRKVTLRPHRWPIFPWLAFVMDVSRGFHEDWRVRPVRTFPAHFFGSPVPERKGDGSLLACRAKVLSALLAVVFVLHGCVAGSEGDSGVFLMEPGKSAPRWIGSPGGAPVWAPGGDAVIWGTDNGLLRFRLEDGDLELLTQFPIAGKPVWSPDGEAIAVGNEQQASLDVIDAQTGAIRFTTPTDVGNSFGGTRAILELGGPAWAPDGSRLAYPCWDGSGDEVCVIQADGTGSRQVTHVPSLERSGTPAARALAPAISNLGPPAWSPDSASFAVAVYPEQRGAPSGIYVVDLNQGSARRIAAMQANSEIHWSLDGSSLLFSTTEEGRSEVVRLRVEDNFVERLSGALAAGARNPVLSPDGSRIAATSDGDIVVIDADGTIEPVVEAAQEARDAAWSPSGEALAFVLAPDPVAVYP